MQCCRLIRGAFSFLPVNTRRILLWLHRWVGVITGLVLLVVTVTGALLVFEREYDRFMHPQFYAVKDGPKLTAGQCLDVLYEARGDMPILGMLLPKTARDPLVVHSRLVLYIDPTDGHVLGTRPRGDAQLQTLLKLHVNLLQGRIGNRIVAAATLLTVGLALTGLWLWWPLRIWRFCKGPGFRRFNLDLHSMAGLYSSLFLLIIAVTGATMAYLGERRPPPPLSSRPAPGRHRISVDAAIQAAAQALPGARIASLEMPMREHVAFHLQLAFPEDGSQAGRSIVNLDQYTGEPLQILSTRAGSLSHRYFVNQLNLHAGTIGGMTTKVMALLACVALLVQILSGYVLWWKRK